MLWLLGAGVVASVLLIVWGLCGISGEQSRNEERYQAWRVGKGPQPETGTFSAAAPTRRGQGNGR